MGMEANVDYRSIPESGIALGPDSLSSVSVSDRDDILSLNSDFRTGEGLADVDLRKNLIIAKPCLCTLRERAEL